MSAVDLSAEFATRRYAIWRDVIDPREAARLQAYALKRAAAGTMVAHGADQAQSAGSDFFMDGLLADLAPRVEQAVGVLVWPTYSYLRVYRRGDVLGKHTDRPSCEISLTLCLGFAAPATWPIWIEGPLGTTSVALNPGDALLYRGVECPHWRERFDGETAAQVFLHYVDRSGPNAEWKYDKRPSLAASPFAAPTADARVRPGRIE